VRFVDDPELAYVAARLREVHDFWHVLFGCHTNVFGETALKAVEFVQTGLPMTAAAVGAGAWRMAPADRAVLTGVYLPWALRAGARCAAPRRCPESGAAPGRVCALQLSMRAGRRLGTCGQQQHKVAAERVPAALALTTPPMLPRQLCCKCRSADLATLYYERHLGEELQQLRARWRIETAPERAQNAPRTPSAGPAAREGEEAGGDEEEQQPGGGPG
jgi:hypothetical protein